jgi:tryptophanyl-tRNA synthetase
MTISSSGDPVTAIRTQDTFDPTMRIFSGIQPSGDAHIGNYSGGFRQYRETQERGDAIFCIVDLHAITLEHDPVALREGTLDITAWLVATGIDPDRSVVFAQSHVTAHAEAAWLLSSVTGYGQLSRMTQFKEKSATEDFVSAALFTYPVLMAGDILLYQTDLVPIGDDQRQHLELSRDVAQRFNSRYGETFVIPEGVYPKTGGRVMNLQDPDMKMSKSRGAESGTVLMLDAPDTIRKKVRSAVTDSGSDVRYDPEGKPGISNLIELMTVVTGDLIPDVEARYDGSGYGQFKSDVADAIVELLEPIQARYREVRGDPDELRRLLAMGAEKARALSAPTLSLMYERLGFAR